MRLFNHYYSLTKPGIIRGNLITAVAGYLFASQNGINILGLLWMAAGTTLVIAGGCVYNNIIDRKIDKLMSRTKSRALPMNYVSRKNALVYATILTICGFSILYFFTNLTTFFIGVIGIVFYVVIYGYFKRKTVFGTEVGTVSGATPILAGYTAAHGHIDGPGMILFLIMCIWQMPHFYAISIFRLKDYTRARLPVISVSKSPELAKARSIIYIFVYILVTALPYLLGYASIYFAIVMFGIGSFWLFRSLVTYRSLDTAKWAGKSFGISLVVLLVFSAALSLEAILG